MDIDNANQIAVERMMSTRPILKGVATARDVIPGMKDNLLLHAGPPIEWARMSSAARGDHRRNAVRGAGGQRNRSNWRKEARSSLMRVIITARSVRWRESHPLR